MTDIELQYQETHAVIEPVYWTDNRVFRFACAACCSADGMEVCRERIFSVCAARNSFSST